MKQVLGTKADIFALLASFLSGEPRLPFSQLKYNPV